jgi:DNA repair exonuclease SbcCD nuclease subunit
MKIVHAADLHIDSPLVGLVRYPGAPADRIRNGTRKAFERIVGICLEQKASFLVLAGDVFDGDWKDYNTGLFFLSQLRRLREVSCTTILVRGNHDAASAVAMHLEMPETVREFATNAPHSIPFEAQGVVFHGFSYPKKDFREMGVARRFPAPVAGMLNVGVLHTNVGGSGSHEDYAPSTIDELVGRGYQYWALGHVHAHEVLHREPWVVYPGNPQGRSVRETGRKGCVVVATRGTGIASAELVETSSMEYFVEELTAGADDDRDAIRDAVRRRLEDVVARADGRLAAVRLVIRGACAAHEDVAHSVRRQGLQEQIRADAGDVSDDLWVEKILFETSPAVSIEALRAEAGLVGDLLRRTLALREDQQALAKLAKQRLEDLKKKCGKELEALGLDLDRPDVLAAYLGQAEALLAQRLTDKKEGL